MAKVSIIKADGIDFNDKFYQAPLIELPCKLEPSRALRECIGEGGRFLYEQTIDAKCTGIALANTIDLLRIRQMWDGVDGSWDLKDKLAKPKRVSAEMLYRMGLAFDEFLDDEQQGSTLRGVLRGFEQNGVCIKENYADDIDSITWKLTIERCKKAREITLGTYARLKLALLDYHTALVEVGALLVSSKVHSGWLEPKGGKIIYSPTSIPNKPSHAFVIIGYNEEGFLVLNSMGKYWGNWIDSNNQAWKGVALWRYEDWYANLLDAWVIRLGVPYSNEEKALAGLFSTQNTLSLRRDQAQGVTRIMIQGHYLHTRDGQFVGQGVFVSDIDTVNETAKLLRSSEPRSPYRKLVFFVESGLGSMKQMAERSALITAHIKASHPSMFPLFIIWREDVQELVIDLLNGRSNRIRETTGGLPGATKSHLIRYAQDWLQPVWRTLEGEAQRIFQDDESIVNRGVGWSAMKLLMESAVAQPNPMTIHFVVHSSGFVWMSAFAKRLQEAQNSLVKSLSSAVLRRTSISSIDLLSPIASLGSLHNLVASLWGELPVQVLGDSRKPIRIFTLSNEQEKKSFLGGFEGSFLELARVAFPVDGRNPTLRSPNELVGSRQHLTDLASAAKIPAWLQVDEVERYISDDSIPEHDELINDSRLIGVLLNDLANDFPE